MLSRKINGLLHLIRPELSLSAGVCVVAGQVLSLGRLPPWTTAALGFLVAFTLSASALILNDTFDIEVDRINAPDRPLPSGAVSPGESVALFLVATLAGLASAYALGVAVLLVGILFWAIGFLYNWRGKQTGLPGNLMVSASVAVTFILGAMTARSPWNPLVWVFSLMAFFVDLGEEIAGDAMDMEGDKQRASRSLALVIGKARALRVSTACWALVLALGLLPAVLGWLGLIYLVVILLTDALIVFFTARLLRAQTPEAGRRAMRGIYLGGMAGIVAFLLGQFVR